MLDDLKYIHQRDSQDALGVAAKEWQELSLSYDFPSLSRPESVVFMGMGGSALAALLSKTWPGYNLPFEIVRNYDLPKYINHTTLVIISSYSGNTEEAVAALEQALQSDAKIAVITSGGKLEEMVADNPSVTLAKLPQASQPRYAVFYNFKALLSLLEHCHILDTAMIEAEVSKTKDFLSVSAETLLPTVPTNDNPAKKLARELVGKTPVIYAGPSLAPAAYKWKISFNENAKNVAWWNQYPEFNHNEFLGWAAQPHDKPYEVIDLRSSFDSQRIRRRFELSDQMLSGRRPKAHVVEAQGQSLLDQLLWTVMFGDFVSIYLGILNNVDPTEVDLIENFKKRL